MPRRFHGLEVALPDEVEDETMFRFVLRAPGDVVTAPGLARNRGSAPTVRPSLVISRRPEGTGSFDSSQFEAENRAASERDRSFRVLGTGVASCGDRQLVWQEVTFAGPEQLQIFQRHYVAAPVDGYQTLATITAGTRDLNRFAVRFGLSR